MAEFKSFDDFQKELHDPAGARQTERADKEDSRKPRHGERRRRRRLRKQWWYVGATLLIVGAVVFFAPIPLGSIRVYGNEILTRDDILFDGNIRDPINVFQISTSDWEGRLRKDVRIRTAEVTRSFPAYIDVRISERKPIAVIQEELGYAIVDKEGMVIQTGSAIYEMDFPMITGIKLENALLGDIIEGDRVKKALLFLGQLSPQGINMFSEVNVGNVDNFIAYTRDGIAIRLGDGAAIAEQAELAENMVSDVRVRGLSVEYIDASLTSPYIKLKK